MCGVEQYQQRVQRAIREEAVGPILPTDIRNRGAGRREERIVGCSLDRPGVYVLTGVWIDMSVLLTYTLFVSNRTSPCDPPSIHTCIYPIANFVGLSENWV
jgi:hypothetical protein